MSRWIRFGFAELLAVCSVPLLAISLLMACAGAVGCALRRRFRGRKTMRDQALQKRWVADEFRFERAIEKYEELIDETEWRRR